MSNLIFEALNPSRLMTGDRYLKLFEAKEPKVYKDKEEKLKYACKLLHVSEITKLFVYPTGDPALYTNVKIYLQKVDTNASLKNVVKKIFKKAVSTKFKEIDLGS